MPLRQVDEESKSREHGEDKSAQRAHDDMERNKQNASAFVGGQIPLRNLNEQDQNIGLTNLELDPMKNPDAPVDLRWHVSQILMNIGNQESQFAIHRIYKKNLDDNVYNNQNLD